MSYLYVQKNLLAILGALAHADDHVSLMAPPRHTIMKMLEKANLFAVQFISISIFNISKCQLIYYNNDKNCTESDICIAFNVPIIHYNMHAKHLGNKIGIKSTDIDVDACIYDFYKRVNTLIAMFS